MSDRISQRLDSFHCCVDISAWSTAESICQAITPERAVVSTANEVRPEGERQIRNHSVHGDYSVFVDEALNDFINASAVCSVDPEARQLVVPVRGAGLVL